MLAVMDEKHCGFRSCVINSNVVSNVSSLTQTACGCIIKFVVDHKMFVVCRNSCG